MQNLMPPVNTPDKLFHDGDPTQGIEGTIVEAEWLNDSQGAVRDVQQELINVLAAAAMQPDPTKQDQLVTAIKAIINAPDGGWVQTVNGVGPDANGAVEIGVDDIEDAGTAAKGTVVTSQTDTTANRLLNVGWMGLGGGPRQVTIGNETLASFWRDSVAGKSGITLPYDGSPTLNFLAVDAANPTVYVGRKVGTGAITWTKLYSEANKPSASDTGALPSSASSLTVDLNTLGAMTSDGVYYQANNAGATAANHYPVQLAGTLIVTRSAYGCQQMYITYSGRIFLRGLTGNWSGSGPWGLWTEMYGPSNKPGTDDVNCIQRDGCHIGGFASGNVARPYMRHTASDTVVELAKAGDSYTKAQSDAGYQPKGSYAPVSTASRAANGWFQDASTGLIFQWVQGATTTGSSNQTVTFPKAFPNTCLFVNPGTFNTANNDSAEQNFQLISTSNASCVVKPNYPYGDAGSVAALIWAVGY